MEAVSENKKTINVRIMVLAALFCALMVVGAKVKIDFPLVPLTFQAFFAVLAGLLLGAETGFLSVVVYILMGLLGLPVFATPVVGLKYLASPTFGFLLGFAAAAYVAGILTRKAAKPSVLRVTVAAFCGLATIYLFGILYFAGIKNLYLGVETSIWAIVASMVPFLLKDAVLFVFAITLAMRLIPIVRIRSIKA